jgi:dihydroorotate dehydrogenase
LQSGDALTELLETLKQRQLELAEQYHHYVPLVLKVAPDLTKKISIYCKQLLQFKIDGLIVTNTTLSREGVENLPYGDEAGGLSGAPVFEKVQNVYVSLLRFKWSNSFDWCCGICQVSRRLQKKMRAQALYKFIVASFIQVQPN